MMVKSEESLVGGSIDPIQSLIHSFGGVLYSFWAALVGKPG